MAPKAPSKQAIPLATICSTSSPGIRRNVSGPTSPGCTQPRSGMGSLPGYERNGAEHQYQHGCRPMTQIIARRVGMCPRTAIPGPWISRCPTPRLLSLRGGYFWDNYKDLGVSTSTQGSIHVIRIEAYGLWNARVPTTIIQQTDGSNWFRCDGSAAACDITSRGFIRPTTLNLSGFWEPIILRLEVGFQKNVNNVNVAIRAAIDIAIYWDRPI